MHYNQATSTKTLLQPLRVNVQVTGNWCMICEVHQWEEDVLGGDGESFLFNTVIEYNVTKMWTTSLMVGLFWGVWVASQF